MRRVQLGLVRSSKEGLSTRFQQPSFLKTLSTSALRADSFFEKDQPGTGRDSFDSNSAGAKGSSDVLDEVFRSARERVDRRRATPLASNADYNVAPRGRAFRPSQPKVFEVTSEEVLRKADFRNARFLANFMTEGGILVKRRHTGISAKAQRKIAREVKTARSFGLLPFTTQGTKRFEYGQTMENLDRDYDQVRFGGGVRFVNPTPDVDDNHRDDSIEQ